MNIEEGRALEGKQVIITILEWVNDELIPQQHRGMVLEVDGASFNIHTKNNTRWYNSNSLKFCNIRAA